MGIRPMDQQRNPSKHANERMTAWKTNRRRLHAEKDAENKAGE